MARVILVRHGETDWNREEVFRGRIDIKLNLEGHKQAEMVGLTLKDYKIEAVYSSPLKRAVETAFHISKLHNLPVKEVDGFIDMDFGEWQGLSRVEVEKGFKEIWNKWQQEPHKARIPKGEALSEIRERTIMALKDIISKHANGTLVVVSHRVPNKVLLLGILGLDNSYFWQIRQDPCCLNIFSYKEKGFVLELLNDTCHLKRDQVYSDF